MKALIVHDVLATGLELAHPLEIAGVDVVLADNVHDATARVRKGDIDVLILKQVMYRKHTTAVALMAEYRNPGVATILLSPRGRDDALELFEMIPSLHAIVGERPLAGFVSTLALSAAQPHDDAVLVLGRATPVPRRESTLLTA